MATRLVDQFGRPMPTTSENAVAELRAAARTALRSQYDAAQTTKENAKHWRWADDLSAAAANSLSVRRTLRSRARYECLQSNSFGKGIVATIANDFISTGPALQVHTDDRKLARKIELAWTAWTKQVRLNKKLRTARLSKCVDGEAFMMATTNPRLRGPVKLDIRLIEADQVSSPSWIDGGRPNAVDGIKFDEWGNPLEYELLKTHPGDWSTSVSRIHDTDKVSPDYMIHLFNMDRPGQARGIPEVTPALPLFAQLRRFTLATILAAETAADFVAILKTQANASTDQEIDPLDPFDQVPIDRGLMTALPFGYDMAQMKAEHPTTTYEMFRNAILQEIARCVHMPTNKARGDSSGYNYSSSRMDHQIYYHAIEVERSDWEIECLDRIFEWWLDEALLTMPEFQTELIPTDVPHKWNWKPAVSINPKQDAEAVIALRDAGLLTEEEYLNSQQKDPDVHYQMLARQVEIRKAMGWPLPGTSTPPPPPGTPAATPIDEGDAADQPVDPVDDPVDAQID